MKIRKTYEPGDTVRCNMCGFHGKEGDLKIVPYESQCPECKTDEYLMDLPI